jgi:hypothetical protein
MGMFDSLYDADGREWQTKAFDCNLDVYRIGDTVPADCAATYQVEVMTSDGDWRNRTFTDSLATVRDGVLSTIPDQRDERLPLLNYSGHVVAPAKED